MSDVSVVFEMLAAEPRRHLLLLLCEEESVSVPEGLCKRAAAQPQQPAGEATRGPSPPPTSRETLELELTHTHLPKLENAGFIEWDRERQTVCRGPAFPEIEPILGTVVTNADAFPSGLF